MCEVFPLDDSSIIVQRFGDPDQAIFHSIGSEEPNVSFNGKSRDDMDFVIHKSHRFNNALAEKIKFLSFNEIPLESELTTESLAKRAEAHARRGDFEHTIIVFNDDTRGKVVEFFAQIVSDQFSNRYKEAHRFSVKVVGAVGNEIDLNAVQLKIGHYWSNYDKTKSKSNFKEANLVEAVRYCHQSSSVDWAEKYKFLTDCILKLVRMTGNVDENGRHFSASTLRDSLKADGRWEIFRKCIYLMLDDTKVIDQPFWTEICGVLENSLSFDNITAEAKAYLAFTEEATPASFESKNENKEDSPLICLPDNKIQHLDGFQIELSTIHGVKGETHDATLIIETKNHIFDLEAMLPYLTGELPSAAKPNLQMPDKPNSRRAFKPNKVFMRQFYVAMSRPRHLLCLAVHSDRISDDQKRLLMEKGWKVEVLGHQFPSSYLIFAQNQRVSIR